MKNIFKQIEQWVTDYNNSNFKTKHKMGLRPMKKQGICLNPSHNPPMHLCIPQGQEYVHICPGCGYTVTIRNPIIF